MPRYQAPRKESFQGRQTTLLCAAFLSLYIDLRAECSLPSVCLRVGVRACAVRRGVCEPSTSAPQHQQSHRWGTTSPSQRSCSSCSDCPRMNSTSLVRHAARPSPPRGPPTAHGGCCVGGRIACWLVRVEVSCAIPKQRLVLPGSIWVSTHFLCFYAAALGDEISVRPVLRVCVRACAVLCPKQPRGKSKRERERERACGMEARGVTR